MREIRPSGSGEGAVLSRPYLINAERSKPVAFGDPVSVRFPEKDLGALGDDSNRGV